MTFGKVHVFYPETIVERCTASLLLDVDPVGLVPKTKGNESFSLMKYVNDRPYAASSFMSVALNKSFRSALSGQYKNRPELVEANLLLEIKIPCTQLSANPRILQVWRDDR